MEFSKKQITTFIIISFFLFSFAFLDLGLGSSASYKSPDISANFTGNIENFFYGDIILYVHQDEIFDSIVERELITALEKGGFSVTVTDELRDDYGSPFIFVKSTVGTFSYTPIYSNSDVYVQFDFSASGETKYLDLEGFGNMKAVELSLDDKNDYPLLIQGNISLYNEMTGLFTYKHYQNHLARKIATSVAGNLDLIIRHNQRISSNNN
ncbi:MAG: hypothetical protein PWQ75_363 [Methanolobus sp.]|uniref:hypothetical protein n=1 Tax=Methanolobus sp. TaxID=1874737 RepID=UPI0025865FC7|nr:hypothetical protein [Methanolobus sp.]MDK2830611.1 hypothetical protein [Methanolobus sp.]